MRAENRQLTVSKRLLILASDVHTGAASPQLRTRRWAGGRMLQQTGEPEPAR